MDLANCLLPKRSATARTTFQHTFVCHYNDQYTVRAIGFFSSPLVVCSRKSSAFRLIKKNTEQTEPTWPIHECPCLNKCSELVPSTARPQAESSLQFHRIPLKSLNLRNSKGILNFGQAAQPARSVAWSRWLQKVSNQNDFAMRLKIGSPIKFLRPCLGFFFVFTKISIIFANLLKAHGLSKNDSNFFRFLTIFVYDFHASKRRAHYYASHQEPERVRSPWQSIE